MGCQWQNQFYNKSNKKRRGCLFYILRAVITVLIIYTQITSGLRGLDYLAEKDIERCKSYFPFSFQDGDSLDNITHDFTVETSYIDGRGKEYRVEWETQSDIIDIAEDTDSETLKVAINNEGLTEQKKITLSAVYKKLYFGRAKISYDIYVQPTEPTVSTDVEVVKISDLENKTYPFEMEARMDKNNKLISLLGDFRYKSGDSWEKLKVHNDKDALTILNKYKDQFNLGQIDFEYDTVQNTDTLRVYRFNMYIQGIKIDGQHVTLTINARTNQVNSIECKVDRDKLNSLEQITKDDIKDFQELSISQIMSILSDQGYGDMKVTSAKFIQTNIFNGTLVDDYEIFIETIYPYIIQIDRQSGKLAYIENLTRQSGIKDPEYEENDAGKKVTGSYTTETGHKKEIDLLEIEKPSLFGHKTVYCIQDASRKIAVVKETFVGNILHQGINTEDKSIGNLFKAIGYLGVAGVASLLDMDLQDVLYFNEPDTSQSGAAQEAYQNMQHQYDWYSDKFNIYSYDNSGQPIILVNEYGNMRDNAACVQTDSVSYFALASPDKYDYQLCTYLDVMGHEYTHAVYKRICGNYKATTEQSGIDEGYADIFGTLIESSQGEIDWFICETSKDGQDTFLRDIANFEDGGKTGRIVKTYKGDNWEANLEQHQISVLISHIAYEMYQSGQFTLDEIANIWMTSLKLGYNGDQTFVDCRRNVIKSLQLLGYSKETQDKVAGFWDAENILDSDYVIQTVDKVDEQLNDEIDSDKMRVTGKSVQFVQVLGALFGDIPVYIWQLEPDDEQLKMTAEEQEKFGQLIAENFNNDINDIKVVYKQVGKLEYTLISTFLNGKDIEMQEMFNSAVNQVTGGSIESLSSDTKNILGVIWKLCFAVFETECSPKQIYEDQSQ